MNTIFILINQAGISEIGNIRDGGNIREVGISERWEYQRGGNIGDGGNIREVGISERWEYQRDGNIREAGISERWEYQRGGNIREAGISERREYQRGGNIREAGLFFQSMNNREGINFNILNNKSNKVNVSIEQT